MRCSWRSVRPHGHAAALLPIAVITAYLVLSYTTTKMWLPVSGSSKAGLALSSNLLTAVTVLTPSGLLLHGALGTYQLGFRVLLLLTPLAVGVLLLVRRVVTGPREW